MKTWYKPYLNIYEKDSQTVPAGIIRRVKKDLEIFTQEKPLLSIVVIAYNEAHRLLSCLWSLSHQHCKERMELIVVNNHSADHTEDLLKTLDVVYYNEERRGPGFARQCGLERATGKYIICIDADTIYPPHYVHSHLTALQKSPASCAFSLWSFMPKSGQSAFSLFMYEWFRDLYLHLQYIKRPELCVRGMVFSFHAAYGRMEGFRTDIKRGEDGSMALALKKYGKIVFIRDRKARAMTGYGTLGAQGSLSTNFKHRFIKALRSIPGLFSRKSVYQDDASNMLDKTRER